MSGRRRAALAVAVALLLAVVAVVAGLIPVRASSGHWRVTSALLHFIMQRSVSTYSVGREVPSLDQRALVQRGAGHYETGCRPCHGAPGWPAPPVAGAMTPPPPLLAQGLHYQEAELFEIVKHGIKFTGMPAWPAQTRDDEVWAVVAFLRRLPGMDPDAYRRWVEPEALLDRPGDEAPDAVLRHCARCHGVEGRGPASLAFPQLAGQRAAYLEESLTAYAEGNRHSGIMQPVAAAVSPADRRRLAEWFASREPTRRARKGSPRGAEIAEQGIVARGVPACADCHGPSAHPGYPKLAGQYAPYLEQQLKLFASDSRGGGRFANLMRHSRVHSLKGEEIRAVASHYAAERP